jgi:hypothetical protein
MTESTDNDRCDAWYDGSAVCVIAVGAQGDPLDLAEHEAEELVTKLQACLEEARTEESPPSVPNSDLKEQALENEASQIQGLIAGKTLTRVFRPRPNEIALEFSDGTRFLIDTKSIPEFSIT